VPRYSILLEAWSHTDFNVELVNYFTSTFPIVIHRTKNLFATKTTPNLTIEAFSFWSRQAVLHWRECIWVAIVVSFSGTSHLLPRSAMVANKVQFHWDTHCEPLDTHTCCYYISPCHPTYWSILTFISTLQDSAMYFTTKSLVKIVDNNIWIIILLFLHTSFKKYPNSCHHLPVFHIS
jgi:hypothetical protein